MFSALHGLGEYPGSLFGQEPARDHPVQSKASIKRSAQRNHAQGHARNWSPALAKPGRQIVGAALVDRVVDLVEHLRSDDARLRRLRIRPSDQRRNRRNQGQPNCLGIIRHVGEFAPVEIRERLSEG